MIPVARLKKNLDFNRNLGEIIEVMKVAATLQFNALRTSQEPFVRFRAGLEEAFAVAAAAPSAGRSRFLWGKEDMPGAIVLISSDEGFLGELSALLVNRLLSVYRKGDQVIVVGEQGANYLRDLDIPFEAYPSFTDKLEFNLIQGLRDRAFALFNEGKAGKVTVIGSQFVNISLQQVESAVFLPLGQILPMPAPWKSGHEAIIEPDLDAVFVEWVRLWMLSRLYQMCWSSRLAECAARIMHLEGSGKELGRMNQQLRLEYFKYLHGLSDKTIREIVAARLMIRN